MLVPLLLFYCIDVSVGDPLSDLRGLFSSPDVLSQTHNRSLNAYLLPHTDPHESEYVADFHMRTKFLSGFSGSNAFTVVTKNDALLWTDSRYFIQAEKQLYSGFKFMKDTKESVSYTDWLRDNLARGDIIGFDPELLSYDDAKKLTDSMHKIGISVVPVKGNLVDKIWSNRPKANVKEVIVLSDDEVGESVSKKIERLREELTAKKHTAAVFTELDDIMWFLNIRGFDILYNPQAFSYLVVDKNTVTVFIDQKKLNDKVKKHFEEAGVKTSPYEELYAVLMQMKDSLKEEDVILIPEGTNYAIASLFEEKMDNVESPIKIMKAVKNEVEIKGSRKSHLRDSVALIKFFYWMEKELLSGKLYSEIELAEKIDKMRSEEEKFMDLSFPSGSAGDQHTALPHYGPQNGEGHQKISANSVYMLDSGAHYRDGTTDVTRTLYINASSAPAQFIHDNTMVLKGHINLATNIFPQGTTGTQLDPLARYSMWNEGMEFGHGTGHGFGFFLNVHEGPVGIGTRGKFGFKEGMFTTIEPGFYEEGKWGIRIENCYEVKKSEFIGRFGKMLEFSALTLVPIQTSILDLQLLEKKEVDWLNEYHKQVLQLAGEELKKRKLPDEFQWLQKQCAPIEKKGKKA